MRLVTVHADYGNDDDAAQITRPARPGGELPRVDNPANVTSPAAWKPPVNAARVPLTGVPRGPGFCPPSPVSAELSSKTRLIRREGTVIFRGDLGVPLARTVTGESSNLKDYR